MKRLQLGKHVEWKLKKLRDFSEKEGKCGAVIAAVNGRDETITFVGVEEFDSADRHEAFPFHENEDPSAKARKGLAA